MSYVDIKSWMIILVDNYFALLDFGRHISGMYYFDIIFLSGFDFDLLFLLGSDFDRQYFCLYDFGRHIMVDKLLLRMILVDKQQALIDFGRQKTEPH